jgi:hypothetical protein
MLWKIFWIGVRVTVIKLILDIFLILELNLIVIWITSPENDNLRV